MLPSYGVCLRSFYLAAARSYRRSLSWEGICGDQGMPNACKAGADCPRSPKTAGRSALLTARRYRLKRRTALLVSR
jgi:hypothetical protein